MSYIQSSIPTLPHQLPPAAVVHLWKQCCVGQVSTLGNLTRNTECFLRLLCFSTPLFLHPGDSSISQESEGSMSISSLPRSGSSLRSMPTTILLHHLNGVIVAYLWGLVPAQDLCQYSIFSLTMFEVLLCTNGALAQYTGQLR